MGYCQKCGRRLEQDARFCSGCGTPVGVADDGYEDRRRYAYAGKVIKCPSCGTEISSFTAICPGCGHEINSTHISVSLRKFIEILDEHDKKVAFVPKVEKDDWASEKYNLWWILFNFIKSTLGLFINFGFKPDLNVEEKKKAAFIENYAFTNERETILEALFFIESKVAFLVSKKVDKEVVFWSRLWTAKAKQLYRKASMMLRGDAVASEVYEDILNHNKQIKNRYNKKRIFASGAVLLLIVTMFFILPRVFIWVNPNSAKSVWPKTGAAALLPVPEGTDVTIVENSAVLFSAELDEQSSDEFRAYVGKCKEYGFNLEIKEKYYADLPTSQYSTHVDYSAYNQDGYWLVLNDSFSTELYLFTPDAEQEIPWDRILLANEIPRTANNVGVVDKNTNGQAIMKVRDTLFNDYQRYIYSCQDFGYTLDVKETDLTYTGYNDKGYEIKLTYEKDLMRLTIDITAPKKMTNITWPNSSIVKMLPKPSSMYGEILYDRSDYFSANIGNTSKEGYQKYVDECLSNGFDVDYDREEEYFYAENKKGYDITVKYKGGSVMYVEISAPD